MATSLQLPQLTVLDVDPATRTKRSVKIHRVLTLVVHYFWILLQVAVFGAIVLWPWENLE
jgi:hypothetical protein